MVLICCLFTDFIEEDNVHHSNDDGEWPCGVNEHNMKMNRTRVNVVKNLIQLNNNCYCSTYDYLLNHLRHCFDLWFHACQPHLPPLLLSSRIEFVTCYKYVQCYGQLILSGVTLTNRIEDNRHLLEPVFPILQNLFLYLTNSHVLYFLAIL